MVEASIARAEKRKALSGSSRSSAPAALGAVAASRRHIPRRTLLIGRIGTLSIEQAGLGGDPVQVSGNPRRQWDSDDFREFIRVPCADRRLERRIAVARGLD